jgi:hypothetical protein
METAENMANAFEAEAGTAPVVNVSGVDAPTVTSSGEATNSSKFYTEDDLAKVRSQEKDKLYPEIERLKEELSSLKKEKEEKAARKAAKDAEELATKEAKQKAKLEDDLDAKELIKIKEQEWQEQLERERNERERAFALLEQERKFADLQAYRQQVLDTERDNIIPQLVDFIQGSTPEEINTSVEELKSRSQSILESAQAALTQQRRDQVGTRATLPPAGPLETNSEQRMPTAEEIAAMPMNEYAKIRNRILSNRAQGKNSGILG